MADANPFAAPVAGAALNPVPDAAISVWRDGDLLVMHKQAVLPDRCVKCNAPCNGYRLNRSLSWHPPGWFLLILISLWIYLIVALCIRKTAKIQVGLCEQHRSGRRKSIWGAWLMFLSSFVGIVLSIAFDLPLLAVLCLLLILGSLIWAVVISNVVKTHKIDDYYVWLKKINAEYLGTLPPIQG
jgi:hypothetical protein